MIKYSDEQKAVIDSAGLGADTGCRSPAGSGKTRIVAGIVDVMNKQRKKGHVFYFGNENAKEGRARLNIPANRCTTFHSFAFRYVSADVKNRVRSNVFPRDVMRGLKVGYEEAYYAIKTVDNYCKSDDDKILNAHVVFEFRGAEGDKTKLLTKDQVVAVSEKLWSEQVKIGSKMPVGFGHILKIFALAKFNLNFDYIIVDEFQDTSPVTMGIIKREQERGTQIIGVGDPNQAIMGFSGAVNSFDYIDFDNNLQLTRSYRSGQAIVDLSSHVLNKYGSDTGLVSFKGLDNKSKIGVVTHPKMFLARTNYSVLSQFLALSNSNEKPFIIGGSSQFYSLVKDCGKLRAGQSVSTGGLAGFEDWDELEEFADTGLGIGIRPLVSSVNEYGVDFLLSSLARSKYQRKDSASIILSTIHKSKGLEADSVQFADDFRLDKTSGNKGIDSLTGASKRLLYVGITRARKHLDVCDVSFLDGCY